MQNDYLNNKKKFNNLNLTKKFKTQTDNTYKSQNVDINKLLNRVKTDQKNKKKENILFFGLVGIPIIFIGIIAFV